LRQGLATPNVGYYRKVADEENDAQEIAIHIDPAQMAGVWANFARVSHSEHEFTLDFVRMDSTTDPPGGIVVARVSVSPLFIQQLIEALQGNWTKFAKKAMPKEVYGDEQSADDSGDEEDAGSGS
jgi:Protein of unknown function (DUF3467)